MAASFIGGGNQSIWRKPPTCRKSPINFIYYIMLYRVRLACATFSDLIPIDIGSFIEAK